MAEKTVQTPELSDLGIDCFCEIDGVIDLLGRRYTMQIICLAGEAGPVRFGEIERVFEDASSSTLSTRLEELVEADLLSRKQYNEIPPHVEYSLTPEGEELCEKLQPLVEWAEERVDS